MADGVPEGQVPDLKTLHKLIRLMHRYGLTAMDLGEGPGKIRLRRGSTSAASVHQAISEPVAAQVIAAPPSTSPSVSKPAEAEGTFISSPMVGTFYTSSSPDAPAFVSVGTTVRKDMTVCIIEAMKVFTEIPAGMSGTVTEIMVKNGQAVEYGQPLFRLS